MTDWLRKARTVHGLEEAALDQVQRGLPPGKVQRGDFLVVLEAARTAHRLCVGSNSIIIELLANLSEKGVL